MLQLWRARSRPGWDRTVARYRHAGDRQPPRHMGGDWPHIERGDGRAVADRTRSVPWALRGRPVDGSGVQAPRVLDLAAGTPRGSHLLPGAVTRT